MRTDRHTIMRLVFGLFLLSFIARDVVGIARRRTPYVRRALTTPIAANKDCYIPRGEQFTRSVYRLRYGYNTRDLPEGHRVTHNKAITIFCKKDRYYDSIIKYHRSVCRYGKWRPYLPQCKQFKRCDGLVDVTGAVPSERIGASISYPHGTEVTYTCANNYSLRGNNRRICQDGLWSNVQFKCVARDRCRSIPVPNGLVGQQVSSSRLTFKVRCITGFFLQNTNDVFRCENGTWVDDEPRCSPVICPDIKHTYTVSNDPQSSTTTDRLVHGITVTLNCKGRTSPYLGVTSATCYNGKWDPMHPKCKAYCLLPSPRTNIPSIFKYSKTGKLATGMIYHRQRIIQTCKTSPNRQSKEVVCSNGVWTPKFTRCPSISNFTRRSRLFHGCDVPGDTSASYYNVNSTDPQKTHITNTDVYIMETIDHGKTLFKMCNTEDNQNNASIVINTQDVSQCLNGTWSQSFRTCPALPVTAETKCYVPLDEDVLFEPTQKDFEINDTIHVTGCQNSSLIPVGPLYLRCLDDGFWNGTVDCQLKNLTCFSPTNTSVFYEPKQKEYTIGETIHITGCQDNSHFPAGSTDMTCSDDGMWSGAVECISFCENGVETLDTTDFTYFDRSSSVYKFYGVLDSVEDCFMTCLEYDEFVCKAIEIRKRPDAGGVNCFLIAEIADGASKKFVKNEQYSKQIDSSKVYNRGCDERCRIPEVNITFVDYNDNNMVARQYTQTGAIIRISCHGQEEIVSRITCMGGSWDKSIDQSLCDDSMEL